VLYKQFAGALRQKACKHFLKSMSSLCHPAHRYSFIDDTTLLFLSVRQSDAFRISPEARVGC
jgi:hypothetical protein